MVARWSKMFKVVAGLGIAMAVAPAIAQFYQGTMTSTTTRAVTIINMRLTFEGNAISGGMGIGSVVGGAQIVGQLQPNIPVQGTRTGSTCTLRVVGNGAGMVMTGPCSPTSFSGTFTVGAQSGRFSVTSNGASATPAVPVVTPPPQPPTIPNRPMASPAPSAPLTSTQAATKYCGTDRNTSYNISWDLVVTIDPGAAFTGSIVSGDLVSGQTANENRRIGDGDFTGTRTGTSCNGTTQAGEVFTGTCTPTSFTATYTALGQHGTLNATTRACGANGATSMPVASPVASVPRVAAPTPVYAPAPVAKTAPAAVAAPTPVYAAAPVAKTAPAAVAAPTPVYAPAAVAKTSPAAATPSAAVAAAPVTAPAPTGAKYCGTDTNTTFNISWNLVVTINPGTAFTGSIVSGDLVSGSAVNKVGDGGFTGTRTGTSCNGTTQAGEVFTGTCTPTSFSATYTALGQHGTLKATTQACGGQK